MRETFQSAIRIIKEHNGIIKTGQAKKLGVDPKTLARMVEAGNLVREGRGIYRLADLQPTSNPDLIHVALRIPSGVICLISALAFHELTTQIPYKVYIALPKGKKPTAINYPPINVVTLSENSYMAGIENHILGGVNVLIYAKEKTIADCFKFRNKIGLDIAIEALKDYFKQPNPNIQKLMEFAEINRVGKLMRPYIEAML